MANTFKRYTKNAVGTSFTDIITTAHTSGKTAVIIIGGVASNTNSSSITMEVVLNDGTNDINILGSDTIIPPGSALSFIDGKIVLEDGDSLKIKSTATIDTVVSVMEITP
jgi:hypothetical protein